jgi:hypothetical protein
MKKLKRLLGILLIFALFFSFYHVPYTYASTPWAD